jgi:hypothetical protein
MKKIMIKKAFSLLEVQIAMIVLTIGMMGLITTFRIHSRQMEKAESWCKPDMEYNIVSQSNTWMRRIGIPAELTGDPNFTVWQPPVTGDREYEIELDSFTLDYENRTASVDIIVKKK